VAPRPAAATSLPRGEAQAAAPAQVPVRYLKRAHLALRGSVSGRTYEFSLAQPVRAVDARDVEGLLLTRLFARAA
jgi:hypothetical protein